jgi:hypothetical protein
MNTYDNAMVVNYELRSAALDGAAELVTLVGPKGKTGRVVGMQVLVTVEVTGTSSVVSVNTLDNAVVAGSLTVPAGLPDTFVNDATTGTDDTLIPADTAFTVDCNGAATAGDGNVAVQIAWF